MKTGLAFCAIGALSSAACVGPMGPPGPSGKDGSITSQQEYESVVDILSNYEESILTVDCQGFPDPVTKEVKYWRGSGAKVSGNSVLTALHVAAAAAKCSFSSSGVYMGSSGTSPYAYKLTQLVLANGVPQDIATIDNIIWNSAGVKLPEVPINNHYFVRTGELVCLMSYPYDIVTNVQYAFGHVVDNQIRTPVADLESFSADFVAAHGSSGGPVFNRDGEIIGVNVAGYDNGVLDEMYVMPTNGIVR